MKATQLYTIVLFFFLFPAIASAQVFDSGPNDSGLFDMVFDLPGDSLPSTNTVGGVVGETTQVNLTSGGTIGGNFNANSGTEVNISGGQTGTFFNANDGSEINISGGSIGPFFFGFSGSEININGGDIPEFISSGSVNISGGQVGDSEFSFLPGAEVNITGGTLGSLTSVVGSEINLFGSDFVVDGGFLDLAFGETLSIPIPELNSIGSSTLSGLLADGSAFSFLIGNNVNQDSTLTVTSTAVPEPTSMVILLIVCGLAGTRRTRFAA